MTDIVKQIVNIAGITIVSSVTLALVAAVAWLCIVVYKDIKRRLK